MDPIVAEAIKAVQGLGAKPGEAGSPIPVHTERGRTSAFAGAGGGSGVVVGTTRGSGILGYEDQTAGSALNPTAQLGLMAKIRKEADWMKYTSLHTVSEKTGFLDLWDDRSFRMHPTASEGARTNIPSHKPDVDSKTFSTKTLSGAFAIRLGALRQAARANRNVNGLVQAGIAAGIGNVFADVGINGNADLPADSDLNKQRRTTDGWFQKIRENSSNYTSLADGFSYSNNIWAGMLQTLDKPIRADRGLAWGLSDTLGTRWLTELTATGTSPTNSHPSIVNNVGQQLLNAVGAQANPLGKMGIVIPQLDDDRFSSGEGYTGVNVTSIVNNGDGTLTINVNSLATSGVNRGSAGTDGQRYVVVGRRSTGVEETLAIDYSAPNNTVTTVGLLGQTVVSTTAADYYVRWADTQSLALGLWRYLGLVVQNGIRVYSLFYPHDEVIEVIIHADIDYLVADYDAFALTDDIITPRFGILPT